MNDSNRIFRYKNNSDNLFNSIFGFGLASFFLYGYSEVRGVDLLMSIAAAVSTVLFLFIGIWYFKTFIKLLGNERLIIFEEMTMTLPEHGDSLNEIRLNFSQIQEIYFTRGRNGKAENLILRYDSTSHASIVREYLTKAEFEAVCELLKQRLVISEIELK